MPNHFHFLIASKENVQDNSINKAIQIILSSYSQAINEQENRTGSLFQQHTKAKSLVNNTQHAEICFHYIHQNPLRADLVSAIENWEFSSAKSYALTRNDKMCNLEKARLLLNIPENGSEFLKLSNQVIKKEYLDKIL